MEQSYKRGRLEIVQEILAISRKSTRKTRILYGCNLSYNLIQKYLEYVTSNNLLTNFKNNDHTFYLTTEKGIQFLKEYKRLNNLCPKENNGYEMP